MGTEVARLALAGAYGADPAATVGVDLNACGAEGMPCATSFASATDPVFTSVDCIVDFSHHAATPALLDFAVTHGIPVVLATTGGRYQAVRPFARVGHEAVTAMVAALDIMRGVRT